MKKQVSEKQIEKKLVDGVKAIGGVAMKFVSPGRDGVSDRIVLMPGGRIWFVELKKPGGKLSPLQERFGLMVNAMGFQYRVLGSVEAVTAFIEWLKTSGTDCVKIIPKRFVESTGVNEQA